MPTLNPVSFTQGTLDPQMERKRKMAELLRQKGMEPLQAQPNAPISPLSGLAKMLNAYTGARFGREVDESEAEQRRQYQTSLANALTQLQSGNREGAMSALGQSPYTSELAFQLRMKDADRQQDQRVILTPEEEAAAGLPAEGVYQRDPLGEIKPVWEPPKPKAVGDEPSNVQEWEFYNKLTPEQKQEFLTMKRATKILDTGGGFSAINPAVPTQATPILNKTLAPQETPEVKAAQAAASAQGKASGEAGSELTEREAAMPRLEQVVNELSDLGKKATYTYTGQAADSIKRQLGMNVGEGAVSRTEYISKVDNEVLPLLRQTFGAQFTQKEGESLKVTLGDPNKSPAEKDAVLRSFIKTKQAQIETLKRRTGVEETVDWNSLP